MTKVTQTATGDLAGPYNNKKEIRAFFHNTNCPTEGAVSPLAGRELERGRMEWRLALCTCITMCPDASFYIHSLAMP